MSDEAMGMDDVDHDAKKHKQLEEAGTFVEPESLDAGRDELIRVMGQISDINVQITERASDGTKTEEYRDWHRRALRARWYLAQRQGFLQQWVSGRRRDHKRDRHDALMVERAQRTYAATFGINGPTAALRLITKRVGKIEAVFSAACAYIDEDTDETWDELLRTVEEARSAEQPAGEQVDQPIEDAA